MSLVPAIQSILREVAVAPWRISLETPGVQATVPMLRGVWGAALHGLDPQAYENVFVGRGPGHERTPGYVLRPAQPDTEDAPAIEWIVIGESIGWSVSLFRAWDVASGMGLGPNRRRFVIRHFRPLDPRGQPMAQSHGAAVGSDTQATSTPEVRRAESPEETNWTLDRASVPLEPAHADEACRLCFPSPLRILRKHELVERPTLVDVVVAAVRRVEAYLPSPAQARLAEVRPALLELARQAHTREWEGGRLDLVRYSGRQKQEMELRGVAGHLDVPEGLGDLFPLLAAAQWLHLGKGTAVGMGQLLIERR